MVFKVLFTASTCPFLWGGERGCVILFKTKKSSEFGDHLVLEVTSMVCDNLLWDTESRDNLIEYEIGCDLTIDFEVRHYLFPLSEVVKNNNDVLIPSSRY